MILTAFLLFAAGPPAPPRFGLDGERIPLNALARLGSSRLRMPHPWCSVFLPGGKQLLTGGDDGHVHFWDTKTGREVRSFRAHGEYLLALALSPDGKTLAVAGESSKDVTLWQLRTGRLLHRLKGHTETASCVHFSPDGKLLASGCRGHQVRVWDVARGVLKQQVPVPKQDGHGVEAVAFSPSGKTLAVGSTARDITLWDTTTWKLTRTIKGHADRVVSLAWSPDSRRLYSGSFDQTARVWDARTGRQLRRFEMPDYVGDIATSPDGKTLAAGLARWGEVWAWDTASGKKLWAGGQDDTAMGLSFSPDGKALASLSRSAITLREPRTGKRLLGIDGPAGFIKRLVFSPDGRRLMAAGHGGEVAAWDTANSRRVFLARLQGPDITWQSPVLLRFTARGRALGAVWDQEKNTVSLLTLPGKRPVGKPVQGHTYAALIAPDGTSLVLPREEGVGRWSVLGGKPGPLFCPQGVGLRALHLSRDGRVLLGQARKGELVVWDARTGLLRSRAELRERPVVTALAANGHLAVAVVESATGKPHRVIVLEAATGAVRHEFDGPEGHLYGVALSPDGRLLGVGTTGRGTQLWGVPEGKRLAAVHGHRGATSALEFSPDGKALATGGTDGTVLLWDVPGLLAPRRPPPPLRQAELERLWRRLGEYAGGAAVWELADRPAQAVALLRGKLKRERRWGARLGGLVAAASRGGEAGRKAELELAEMGRLPLPAVHQALHGKLEAEQRKRLKGLARRLDEAPKEAPERRVYRALEVLDSVGTAEAVRLRAELAFDGARVEEP